MDRCRRLVIAALLVATAASALPAGTPRAQGKALDDLMMDLAIAPLDAQAAPLTVKTMDGGRLTLADLKGRALLVYFWATW
jgi:cytochrome oxidase Cu insertion factor (SCO1/SenC/PrrC family)